MQYWSPDGLGQRVGAAIFVAALSSAPAQTALGNQAETPVRVTRFQQQIADAWSEAEGLPSSEICCIVATPEAVWAGTRAGLARFSENRWQSVESLSGQAVLALAVDRGSLWVATRNKLYRLDASSLATEEVLQLDGLEVLDLEPVQGDGEVFWLATATGLFKAQEGTTERESFNEGRNGTVFEVVEADSGCPTFIASDSGLYVLPCSPDNSHWRSRLPYDRSRSWAPRGVHGLALDVDENLWFTSPQGIGRLDREGAWQLWDERDGLPLLDLRTVATGIAGDVWLATSRGAIHFDGTDWHYRQGRRWLPDDDVRDIAVDAEGQAWFATAHGVGRIRTQTLTLSEKASLFEAQIDRFHRRTPYEYVASVALPKAGETSQWQQRDTDNDGLWTGMYGAGECYAYAATGSLAARRRARQAFGALRFLSQVTQGGSHPTDPGFIARTILPTSGSDPNQGHPERDRQKRAEDDASWKLIDPRWPTSADGRWYWKTDASSDELDGHFFFYGLYYDLVAETEAEREAVRNVVLRIVDHILDHDYALVDHDGKPTRWAVFGPQQLNQGSFWWGERGLNSLSILSYLRLAAHVSGDRSYDLAARELIEVHDYAANVMAPKVHTGPGTGNQSDDEMAYMSFYNLLKYERDPELRALWAHAFFRYQRMELRERNPLFNFLYAATYDPDTVYADAFGPVDLAPEGDWLEDSIDTLERYPLDRIDWGTKNSHRLDLVFLDEERTRGYRRSDGKVLPIDERFVEHWNHDPWRLDHDSQGHKLADGASFLLPYYMGLYHGFLAE